ncbi:MAG: hypothetical protein M3R63_02320 [Actinomycetota bacterium]|nr:hypothetical protein [Actinomycetota bacterium]
MFEIETIATPGLGDRSYLAIDGAVAVLIDPQRDIRVLDLAAGGVPHPRIGQLLLGHTHQWRLSTVGEQRSANPAGDEDAS